MTLAQELEIQTVEACIRKLSNRKDCKRAVEILRRELTTFTLRISQNKTQ